MKLTFYAVLVTSIILLMTFVVFSSSADYIPDNSRINHSTCLNTTITGTYVVNITAYVNDASGNPMPDGTVVDFAVNPSGGLRPVPAASPAPYIPYYNGSLNNGSQFASIPTHGGEAVVQYGWFPNNQMPQGIVTIYMVLNNTPNVNNTLFLQFNGTTDFSNEFLIWPPDNTPTATTVPTSTPTPTPLSTMIIFLSLSIGVAIVSGVKRK
jgi:hypothetical protein